MLSTTLRTTRLLLRKISARRYNFASTRYDECFGNVPIVDAQILRESAVEALKTHEDKANIWYDDPVCTILKGDVLRDGTLEKTVDAFGKENGAIMLATDEEIEAIKDHLNKFVPKHDYRKGVRAIEAEILSKRAGELIANQAADFKKQDGVTEIEESIEANVIEQRMNDQLLEDEAAGKVKISRAPVFVGCVSNFSNFLDLCRKVLRHIEAGVPCVVLSRSNTTQHMYRWVQMLSELMTQHEVDEGLLTYASCTISQTQSLFDTFPDGPMHITCSREVAADVRRCHANTLASTGGPNTLVATEATPEVLESIRLSAMIENSGQCTALRHAVVNTDADSICAEFDRSKSVPGPIDSLSNSEFANVFDDYPFEAASGYTIHSPAHGQPCAFRFSDDLPPDNLNEHWRQVYVDVTTPSAPVGSDVDFIDDVASWLVRNQPISLAVNGSNEMALRLFEKTCQVVYTVGGVREHVALTAQARPQDGEIFGEFPVRRELFKYTKYPMIIPSPPPAYNATYDRDFLIEQSSSNNASTNMSKDASVLLKSVSSASVRGYMNTIFQYLDDACGCKTGWRFGDENYRTAVYGIQRPPLNGQMTVVRCESDTTLESVAPILLPFVATNSSDQMVVSCDPENASVLNALAKTSVRVECLGRSEFADDETGTRGSDWYNCIRPETLSISDDGTFPLAGQFVSLWFPMGHIKSAKPNDREFIETFSASSKWLKVL